MPLMRLFGPKSLLRISLSAGCLLALTSVSVHAGKHPEPSVYPLPSAWYLNFRHGLPKRIVVDVPGKKTPGAYWYLTYTVTNNSGKEQQFLPDFQMVTQDGKIHQSDRNIPLPVFEAIKKQEGNDLMITPTEVAGPLHQGEDQAKDSVAIWEEPMARMGTFNIYVGGLNSEFVLAKDNDGKDMTDADGKPITLRKTLELTHVVWGDEYKPGLDEVHDKPERWIMR